MGGDSRLDEDFKNPYYELYGDSNRERLKVTTRFLPKMVLKNVSDPIWIKGKLCGYREMHCGN